MELPSGSGLEWPLTTSAVSAVSHLTVAAPNASSPGRIAPSVSHPLFLKFELHYMKCGETPSFSNLSLR